ncbi:MAG: YdeI/OmpD-associated family protein [Candidatus Nanopelagicales bacterium]
MRMKVYVAPTGTATATIVLTQDQIDKIRGVPGKGRVPLAITYRGTTYRTSIALYRGQWMTVINKEMREGGLVPGHDYTVDLSLDTSERIVEVPADFAKAMRAAGVRKAFDALSYSRRREQVQLIEAAKKPETRQRRIEAALATLGP